MSQHDDPWHTETLEAMTKYPTVHSIKRIGKGHVTSVRIKNGTPWPLTFHSYARPMEAAEKAVAAFFIRQLKNLPIRWSHVGPIKL